MLWLVLALLGPPLWAGSNVFDSVLVRGKKADRASLLLLTGAFTLIPALWIIVTGGFEMTPLFNIFVALGAGMVGLLVYYPYLRALQSSHAANVILLWNASPLFVALLAYLFLHERLSLEKYIAIGLLVLSALMVALADQGFHLKKVSGAVRWMLLTVSLSAIEAILVKKTFGLLPVSTGIVWIGIGQFLTALAFWIVTALRARRISRSWKDIGLFAICGEVLNVAANLVTQVAISIGPISLIKAVGGLQPLFVLLLTPLVFRFASKNAKINDIPRVKLKPVLIASVLAIFGLFLLGDE